MHGMPDFAYLFSEQTLLHSFQKHCTNVHQHRTVSAVEKRTLLDELVARSIGLRRPVGHQAQSSVEPVEFGSGGPNAVGLAFEPPLIGHWLFVDLVNNQQRSSYHFTQTHLGAG